jgi:hypothetical protein
MKYLIAAINEKLDWFWADELHPEGLTINGVHYRNVEGGDWTGFYDFLRKRDGTLTGIRYWPFEGRSRLWRSVKNKPHVRARRKGQIELYFSPDRKFAAELSGDQDFGENMVLESDNGGFAITFGLGFLTSPELSQIQRLATGV